MSKYFKGYDVFEDRTIELYRKNPRKADVARQLWEENKEEYGDVLTESKLTSWVYLFLKKQEEPSEIIENREDENDRISSYDENPKETFMPSAWDADQNKFLGVKEYCEKYNLPYELFAGARLVSHNAGHMVYNIGFKNFTPGDEVIDIAEMIDQAVERYAKPIETPKTGIIKRNFDFSRVIYTDVHAGMDPNTDGRSLYGGKWDKEELFDRLSVFVGEILMNAESNILYVDELGDFLDGYDGETVRKGHKLPQNMNNREQFDYGLKFKCILAELLSPNFDKVIFNNICEDNHAGDFGYIVNSSFKRLAEMKHKNVEVINHEHFINHYYVGKHAFVITHGKDSKNLKFGFKPDLDTKQIEKIDQYLKENGVYKRADFIEFSKGDSHQMKFDYCSSDDFDYFNYPAFSPSSNWVQTNFKKGRSGFVIQNGFNDKSEKQVTPFFFDWKK
jgi:hypothetical protein